MRRPGGKAELLLVCSSGGHLLQLLALKHAWEPFSRIWITFDKSDARSLLAEEKVLYAHGPTNRSVKNLVRNLLLAWRVLGDVRPTVLLTTGAGVSVPFAWIGRLRGVRIVYVESLARIDSVSLSCRLVAPVAERLYVQWPELEQRLALARYAGTVFSK